MKDDAGHEGALQRLLKSFRRYYNVRTEGAAAPFAAEAEFHSHGQHYFLVKAAHLADMDSNEYVFFASLPELSLEELESLAGKAWQTGLSRVHPYSGHRSSDITLVVVADRVAEPAFAAAKKLSFYKSYRFSFYGWSHFRALVLEASSGRSAANRFASDLQKLLGNMQ